MTEHRFDLAELEKRLNGHSIFAPSGSYMWLTCSGSLIPNLMAEDEAGEDAAYGTVGHAIGEEWLKTGRRPSHRIGEIERVHEGKQVFEIEIDELMLNYVSEYVDWCNFLPGTHFVEQRVYFSQLTPIDNQGGTADHFACEWQLLTITDLKLGKGVQVYAAENRDDPRAYIGDFENFTLNGNPQALLYALGVFYEWDWLYNFRKIVIRIAQPRLGWFDVWETTREELLRFAEFVRVRAARAWQPGAPRRATPKACQWCKVRNECPVYAKLLEDIFGDTFDDLDAEIDDDQLASVAASLKYDPERKPTSPAKLTIAQLARAYAYRGIIEGWFSKVQEELERRANDGERVPGYKIVEGRSSRLITDEKEAERRVVRAGVNMFDLYSVKFASAAQMEELLRKKGMKKKDAAELLADVVKRQPGKPTLVPDADHRQELVSSDEGVFDDLDGL